MFKAILDLKESAKRSHQKYMELNTRADSAYWYEKGNYMAKKEWSEWLERDYAKLIEGFIEILDAMKKNVHKESNEDIRTGYFRAIEHIKVFVEKGGHF